MGNLQAAVPAKESFPTPMLSNYTLFMKRSPLSPPPIPRQNGSELNLCPEILVWVVSCSNFKIATHVMSKEDNCCNFCSLAAGRKQFSSIASSLQWSSLPYYNPQSWNQLIMGWNSETLSPNLSSFKLSLRYWLKMVASVTQLSLSVSLCVYMHTHARAHTQMGFSPWSLLIEGDQNSHNSRLSSGWDFGCYQSDTDLNQESCYLVKTYACCSWWQECKRHIKSILVPPAAALALWYSGMVVWTSTQNPLL